MDLPPALDAFADPAPAQDGLRALVLAVGGDRYAVPLADVRVVVTTPRVTRVPEAPAVLLGVTNVRGEVVPVVDLGAALGVGRSGGGTAAATVAVVQTARGPVGLAAGADPDSVVLDEDLGESALVLGLRRHRAGERVVTLVDVEALAARVAGGPG